MGPDREVPTTVLIGVTPSKIWRGMLAMLACTQLMAAHAQPPMKSATETATVEHMLQLARVRDPNASFMDLRAVKAAVLPPSSKTEPACDNLQQLNAPQGSMEIPARYSASSPGHGPANPEQARRAAPYWAMEAYAAHTANHYVLHGDVAQAQCLLSRLNDWAEAGAMLQYDPLRWRQSWYTVEWSTTAIALAVSQIRAEPALDQMQLQRVLHWLNAVARRQLSFERLFESHNNHANWRGLMAASVGVISQDDELLRSGLQRYFDAVALITSDGSWAAEMQRAELSLHYQNFAILPLVGIAELAARQGIDVYGVPSAGHRLREAVGFLQRAISDPAVMQAYQPMPQKAIDPSDLAWILFWQRRFVDPLLAVHQPTQVFTPRFGGAINDLLSR